MLRVVLLAMLVGLSGCLTADATEDPAPAPPVAAVASVPKWDVTSSGCMLSDLQIPMSAERVQQLMPEAYEATPNRFVPTMNTAIVTVHRCEDSVFGAYHVAELFVFLVHPELSERVESHDADNRTRVEDATFSPQLYAFAAVTDAPELLAIFEAIGVPAVEGTFTHEIAIVGPAARSSGSIRDDAGVMLEWEGVASGAPGTVGPLERVVRRQFRENETGLALNEHDIFHPDGSGVIIYSAAGHCTVRADSLFGEVLGAPCSMPRQLIVPPTGWGWRGAAYWFEGERAS